MITIKIFGTEVRSKHFMNVLAVTFDSKLNWSIFTANCISKAKKALFALLRTFFDKTKMRTLLDSNVYSILYYNASIWLSPDLSAACKHDLLAVSSLALRSCLGNQNCDISFVNLHKNNKKCTPAQIMLYQLAINLFKMVNLNLNTISPTNELIRLLDQVVITRRQVMFEIYRINRDKIGMNAIENKLYT